VVKDIITGADAFVGTLYKNHGPIEHGRKGV
jgi:hypothetical protein